MTTKIREMAPDADLMASVGGRARLLRRRCRGRRYRIGAVQGFLALAWTRLPLLALRVAVGRLATTATRKQQHCRHKGGQCFLHLFHLLPHSFFAISHLANSNGKDMQTHHCDKSFTNGGKKSIDVTGSISCSHYPFKEQMSRHSGG